MRVYQKGLSARWGTRSLPASVCDSILVLAFLVRWLVLSRWPPERSDGSPEGQRGRPVQGLPPSLGEDASGHTHGPAAERCWPED